MASEFPTTIKGFGYAFNDAGQLRQINPDDDTITDKPYDFQVSDDGRYNQARYEALGEVLTEHVYDMLVEAGLHKIYIPSPETETSSFVFGTKTDFKDTKKLMFLIHGSGVVRAGQWARSLIINQSTDHGTQLPYIKRAVELGYDVLVTNTNHRYRIKDGERIYLDGHGSPEEHINSVWEQLIEPVLDTIDAFAIVAHSYGGVVTLNMAKNYPDVFVRKCFGIGFTDSVHYAGSLSTKMVKWFRMNARNYVTSSKPLNTKLDTRSSDIPCYSAGHTKHEWTSWACIDALFPFLEEKYAEFRKDAQSDESQSDEENGAAEKKASEEKENEEEGADEEKGAEEGKGGGEEKDADEVAEEEKADGPNEQEVSNDQSTDEKAAENKSDQEKAVQEESDVKNNQLEESADDSQSPKPKKPNTREEL